MLFYRQDIEETILTPLRRWGFLFAPVAQLGRGIRLKPCTGVGSNPTRSTNAEMVKGELGEPLVLGTRSLGGSSPPLCTKGTEANLVEAQD